VVELDADRGDLCGWPSPAKTPLGWSKVMMA
jgi:hypothetical protein